MLQLRRSILFLVLAALVLALVPAAPAGAQLTPVPLNLTVTVAGAGPTLADATEMALNQIREDYFILSYTTSNPLCHYNEILGSQFCSIKVTARVIRRPIRFFP
jgi:hypothetical protein